MQNRRYLRYVRAIRDVIAAGVVGRVGIVNADFYRDPRFDGEVAATYTGNTGHTGCLDEMFAARAAGRESDTSYTDNIRSLAMFHAAIASARRAARIEIDDPLS